MLNEEEETIANSSQMVLSINQNKIVHKKIQNNIHKHKLVIKTVLLQVFFLVFFKLYITHIHQANYSICYIYNSTLNMAIFMCIQDVYCWKMYFREFSGKLRQVCMKQAEEYNFHMQINLQCKYTEHLSLLVVFKEFS